MVEKGGARGRLGDWTATRTEVAGAEVVRVECWGVVGV